MSASTIVLAILLGISAGLLSGLFGVGGGIVRVPRFVYLLPLFGVPPAVLMHVAVGTSIALVLPSAFASTRKQLALGNLDLPYFRTWAIGLLAGVLIGIVLLPFISTAILQGIFAAFMLYVGVTNDLVRRVYEHRMGLADGFTKKYGIHRLVYFEQHSEIEAAILREKRLKKWNRTWKIRLIEESNPNWDDLYSQIAQP